MSGHGEHESIVDPRRLSLTPAAVMARYRWVRTKGYEVMRNRPNGVPEAIGGRYRLDSLRSAGRIASWGLHRPARQTSQ
jgi:hypothetical protein